jgi:hypothetical protein
MTQTLETSDPLASFRLDVQIRVLRQVAHKIEAQQLLAQRHEAETRDVQWSESGHGLRIVGDENLPANLSLVYADDDFIVARRAGYMYVFEVIVREQGGAATRVRKLFVFDPDAGKP